MQTIRVELAERSYTVFIGSGMLGTKNPAINIPAANSGRKHCLDCQQ